MALDGDGIIGYLVDANTSFLITTDPAVLSGFGEPQATGALTNSSLTGGYAGVATDPTAFVAALERVFGIRALSAQDPAGAQTIELVGSPRPVPGQASTSR